MYWQSFKDFITMGGDGLFVWLCIGITLLALAIEWLHLRALWHKQNGEK
ncbi:heme exporter protein CcmD [Neisseria zalophi]|uniref:Heme exporter protein D n=1 Tax=Neisseria zalophi TaxID=640030 RepID=A0A5J6PTX3_9NEIS|nr:heme exporter protein CcmD [Neisseria zalophi]QEY25764.1 heme exporter protein CcmD [Neisseria zalophi]